MSAPTKPKSRFLTILSKWWVITLLVILFILIVIRIILSPVATYEANKMLGTKVPGYYGHVKCIRFALYRGAYKIDSIVLEKVDSVTKKKTPFVSAELIDLSIQWKALFHGKLVGKIFVLGPEVRFTKDKVEPKQVAQDTTTFHSLLDIGMPLDINRVEIDKGSVRYKDETSEPRVDIAITKIHILAQNLNSVVDKSNLLPSTLKLDADVYGGTVNVDAKLNLLVKDPTFDVKAEVKHLDLPKLDSFFLAYGKFTIDKGDFNLYAEAAAKQGDYKGYLKPEIKDLRAAGPSNKDEKWTMKMWEHVIDAVNFVLKNKPKDQLATKVPFEGSFGKTHTNIIYALFQVLRNGFVEALTPSLDNDINIGSVGQKDDKPGFKLMKASGDKSKAKTDKDDTKKEGPMKRRKEAKEKEKEQAKQK